LKPHPPQDLEGHQLRLLLEQVHDEFPERLGLGGASDSPPLAFARIIDVYDLRLRFDRADRSLRNFCNSGYFCLEQAGLKEHLHLVALHHSVHPSLRRGRLRAPLAGVLGRAFDSAVDRQEFPESGRQEFPELAGSQTGKMCLRASPSTSLPAEFRGRNDFRSDSYILRSPRSCGTLSDRDECLPATRGAIG